MKVKYPLVSIAIATLNSEKTLPKLLSSLRKQNYPQNKLEILVIDGGSKDKTIYWAKKFSCKIIPNPKVDLVYAKHIGYKSAKGDFLVFLDSDEVLENRNSIRNKCEVILANPNAKAVISSGYKKPNAYPDINYYINEYGDPFSLFMYKSSRDANWFLKELLVKYPNIEEDSKKIIFDFSAFQNPPFIELISMGVMIDIKYVKRVFPKVLSDPSLHIHLYYLLISKGNHFVFMKKDPIVHYSASTLKSYLKKIRSRIVNNTYENSMGRGGFKGREKFYNHWYKFKKYLFIPYSLLIVLPVLDSIKLFVRNRKLIYFIHPVLCLYAFFLIVFYYTAKLLGYKPRLSGYGN